MSDQIESLPIKTETVDIDQIRQDADRAETAMDTTIELIATDYKPNDGTDTTGALGDIEGMVEGETALVRNTLHIWEYDGTEWIDTGISLLALKADTWEVGNAIVTSGNVLSDSSFIGYGVDGGVVDTVAGSMTIPSAETGNASKIAVKMTISDVSELLGKTVVIRTIYDATEGFIADHAPAGSVHMSAWRDTIENLVGATVTSIQVGTKIIREAEYTITTDDVAATLFQMGGYYYCINGQTGTDHEMTVASTMWYVKEQEHAYQGTSDTMVDRKIATSATEVREYIDEGDNVLRQAIDNDTSGQSSVNIDSPTVDTSQNLNGSVRRSTNGITFGVTIPVGQTGHQSHSSPYFPLDLSDFVGVTLTLAILVELSDPFDPAFNTIKATVRNSSQVSTRPSQTLVTTVIDDTHRLYKMTFVASGDEREIGYALQMFNTSPMVVEEYFEVVDLGLRVSEAVNDLSTRTVLNARLDAQIAKATSRVVADEAINEAGFHATPSPALNGRLLNQYDQVVTVAPSGADYTTLAAALQAIIAAGDASITNIYQVIVGAGIYTDHNALNGSEQRVPDYVDVVFSSPYAKIVYDGPNDGDPAQVEGINVSGASYTYGLDIDVWDARYGIHAESNRNKPNVVTIFDAANVRHNGNADNAAERGVDSWLSTVAFGSGGSSGQIFISRGSNWLGDHGAFGIHNNRDFTLPMQAFNDTDLLGVRQGGPAIGALSVQMLGSGTRDRWRMCGVSGASLLILRTNQWLSNTAALQYADRYEVEIRGHSCTPMPARHNSTARALRIDTLDTVDHEISVSGTAADALMDLTLLKSHAAGGGLSGHVTGHWNIVDEGVGPTLSNHITSMGYRLGDCSVTSKDLVVTVDGTDYTVTFATDMSAVENATILATINGVIGASATATEFDVTSTRHPLFTDTEWMLLATEGIPRKSAVAYDGDYRHVRLMTSADDTKLFAGIAMEDIYPNEDGRIKFAGYLDRTFVRGLENTTATFMDTLSADAAEDGSLEVGGSQGILTAMDSRTWKVGA